MAKLCFVSNTAWSFVRFRTDLLRALVKDGHQVLLLAPADNEVSQLEATGLTFQPLTHLSGQGLNPFSDLLLYREFRQIYARERPDLVIQYTIKPNIYSTWAARSLNVPVIAVITGLGYTFINQNLVSVIASRLYRLALRRASRVWFLNQDDCNVFLNRRLVSPSKVTVIPGEGINCHETFNPALFSAPTASEAGIRFLWIGRLLYDKGILEYVEAAKVIKEKYPGTEFRILGYLHVDNPAAVSAAALEKWTQAGVVQYLGSTEDVRPFLLGTDCVVLPSYREGMSTSLQEAAAMGKPLIASNIPGCRELIEEGISGFLCEAGSTASLVRQLETFVRLPGTARLAMGRQGRKKMIKEFGVEQVIEIYRNTIHEMTNKKNNFTGS